MEIYNENIKDLLVDGANAEFLDLRDDPIKGVVIAGALTIQVKNV